MVDRTTVGDVVIEQQAVSAQGESIDGMRRQVADHVAGRYKVPVSPVLKRTRLAWLKQPESSSAGPEELIECALTRSDAHA